MPLDSTNVFYTLSLVLGDICSESTVLLSCACHFILKEMINKFRSWVLVKCFLFLHEDTIYMRSLFKPRNTVFMLNACWKLLLDIGCFNEDYLSLFPLQIMLKRKGQCAWLE